MRHGTTAAKCPDHRKRPEPLHPSGHWQLRRQHRGSGAKAGRALVDHALPFALLVRGHSIEAELRGRTVAGVK